MFIALVPRFTRRVCRQSQNELKMQSLKNLALSLVIAVWISDLSAQGQLLGPSPQRDIEQGAEVAKLVEQQIGLYPMPQTEAYLREVGGRLVAVVNDPRWKFSFQIVDQQEPNAFAIPGGGIYVSRGLLALIKREDELAGVLAHEIAHVTQRHSAKQQRKGILPGLLSVPGNVVGNVVGENLGALINAPIDTVGGAWLSRYSRGQESESDRIGIRTAAQAGYEPTALADILQRLEQDVASQTGQERRFSIFDSHPMTETRLKDIRSRAAALDAGHQTARRARHRLALRQTRRNVVGRKSRGGCLPEEPVPAAVCRFHHHFSRGLEKSEHAPVCDFGASQTGGHASAGDRRRGVGSRGYRAETDREDADQGPGRTGLDAQGLRG